MALLSVGFGLTLSRPVVQRSFNRVAPGIGSVNNLFPGDLLTGALSQVASTENFGQFQWSPDGRVIAVVRDDSVTSFVDVDGRQLGVLPVGGGSDAWVR